MVGNTKYFKSFFILSSSELPSEMIEEEEVRIVDLYDQEETEPTVIAPRDLVPTNKYPRRHQPPTYAPASRTRPPSGEKIHAEQCFENIFLVQRFRIQ